MNLVRLSVFFQIWWLSRSFLPSQFSPSYYPFLKTYEKLSTQTISTQIELQKGSVKMGKILVKDKWNLAFMSSNMSYK